MRKIVIISLVAFAGLAGWASPVHAWSFFTHGPVIALLGDGEAEDTFGESASVNPGVSCRERLGVSAGARTLRCHDGATRQHLSLAQEHGFSRSSRAAMSFTYPLSANESEPGLLLPEKAPRHDGKNLAPVDAKPTQPMVLGPEVAPDVLLSNATLTVTAGLSQNKKSPANSPEKIAERVESAMLPLFDVRRMAQLALARHWRYASAEQQQALIAEFSTLLVRTYARALASERDQVITYRPLRMAPGETEATVRSTVKHPGVERMTIDYDMEKTTAGWKIYDIRIAGISLITTYQSTFAQTIRESGIDGLIQSLADKNLQADAGLGLDERGARAVLLMYAVMPSVLRGSR